VAATAAVVMVVVVVMGVWGKKNERTIKHAVKASLLPYSPSPSLPPSLLLLLLLLSLPLGPHRPVPARAPE